MKDSKENMDGWTGFSKRPAHVLCQTDITCEY